MKMKKKKISHKYNINRRSSKHGCKYSKYKKFLIMMMLICFKQLLSNTWSSIHEKVKERRGWVEKTVRYKRRVIFLAKKAFALPIKWSAYLPSCFSFVNLLSTGTFPVGTVAYCIICCFWQPLWIFTEKYLECVFQGDSTAYHFPQIYGKA